MVAYSADYYSKNKSEMNKRTAKYHEQNTKFVGFRFNNYSDWDILAKLDAVTNKAGYVKQLIRDDIKRTGFDPGPKPTKPGAPPDPSTLPPVEPVPTVDMDEWRKEHPELLPPEELSKEEALKLLGM